MRPISRRRRLLKGTLATEPLETRVLLHGAEVLGSVYLDLNQSGTRDDTDTGVPGAVIRLSPVESTDPADDLLVFTDDDGNFSFHELQPGSYELSTRPVEGLSDSQSRSRVVTVSDEQVLTDNNFAESGLQPRYLGVHWLLASSDIPELMRRSIADAEEGAGNSELAAAIRTRGTIPADLGGDGGGDEPGEEFGPVTTGPFDSPDLLGIRTDLVAGAPAISRDHVTEAVNYAGYSNPPTYGPHHGFRTDDGGRSITPRPTGIYDTEQPDEDLVHNLEHGHVWVSYNPALIRAVDLRDLQQLVRDGGTNNGVIVTPRAENSSAIAMASWAHLEELDRFDETRVRSFIETNRGHAPEGFIASGQKSPTGGETLDDGLQHRLSPNRPFGQVTPGSEQDPNLRGTRTDLVSGAPAVTGEHVVTAVDYTGYSNPPSYGPHHGFLQDDQGNSITPRPTGIYESEQPDEDLVHNLEHGHVWISYNPALLSDADTAALTEFVSAGGEDTGVILTPRSRNTAAIVITSWMHQLALDNFVAETIRDFVVTNRGHAPEGFIPSGQKSSENASETLDDGLPHSS